MMHPEAPAAVEDVIALIGDGTAGNTPVAQTVRKYKSDRQDAQLLLRLLLESPDVVRLITWFPAHVTDVTCRGR
jgi:hypothetical protein